MCSASVHQDTCFYKLLIAALWSYSVADAGLHICLCVQVIKLLLAVKTHSKTYSKRDLWRASWPTLYFKQA